MSGKRISENQRILLIIPFCREGGVTAQDTYNLYLYERNVQVVGLRSIDAPILIDTIRTGQESGHSIHNPGVYILFENSYTFHNFSLNLPP